MSDLAERYREAKQRFLFAPIDGKEAAEAELDACVREMLKGLCEPLTPEEAEGLPVRWVGVYVLNWGKAYEPEMCFREVDADAILGLTGDGDDDNQG